MTLDSWIMIMSHESWFIIHDFWLMIQDSWLMILDSWFMTHDSDPQCATWVIVSSDFFSHESWFFHYDLLFLNHDSWFMILDSWFWPLLTEAHKPTHSYWLRFELWKMNHDSSLWIMNHHSGHYLMDELWFDSPKVVICQCLMKLSADSWSMVQSLFLTRWWKKIKPQKRATCRPAAAGKNPPNHPSAYSQFGLPVWNY